MTTSYMRFHSLSSVCSAQAEAQGDRIAFRCNDSHITYRDFSRLVDNVSLLLQQQGVAVGDRVALLAKDSIAAYALFFACAKVDAVFVPLNWRLSANELVAILEDSNAKCVFVQKEFADRIGIEVTSLQIFDVEELELFYLLQQSDTRNTSRNKEFILPSLGTPGEGSGVRALALDNTTNFTIHSSPSTPALLPRSTEGEGSNTGVEESTTPVVQIYTSGTTGKPKGVVLGNRTFFDLLNGMKSIGDSWMGLTPDDSLLLSLPLFHIGGLWWGVQGFLAGACGVMMESFIGWKAIELIEQHRITKVAMVPAMIQFTLSEPTIDTANLSSVTGFLYGGSPISPDLLRRVRRYFPCDFFQIYGLTETGNMAVCLRPSDHDDERLWGAAGKPLPGVQVKIVSGDSRIKEPEPMALDTGFDSATVGQIAHETESLADFTSPSTGSAGASGSKTAAQSSPQVGEIWIKSPSVMLGYWNNPQATEEVLDQGWIRTGDAGYLDEDGYLFVCDRIKDMIIYAGENVFPTEIESVLREHESIADVAVIGIPDPGCGELAKAFLVLKPQTTKPKTKELLGFLKGRIADFKIPKSFEFLESLPRNPSGKVLKHILRMPYWENHQRKVN